MPFGKRRVARIKKPSTRVVTAPEAPQRHKGSVIVCVQYPNQTSWLHDFKSSVEALAFAKDAEARGAIVVAVWGSLK